jgi:hypothetical protein
VTAKLQAVKFIALPRSDSSCRHNYSRYRRYLLAREHVYSATGIGPVVPLGSIYTTSFTARPTLALARRLGCPQWASVLVKRRVDAAACNAALTVMVVKTGPGLDRRC